MSYQQTFEPLPALFARFSDLLRSLTPAEESAQVPGMDWTAGEVGAHVLTVLNRYLRSTERAASRARLVELNAEDIAALGSNAARVADDLDATVARVAQVAHSLPLDAPRDFHLGLKVTVAAGWANLIGELLVHGDDIARATDHAWTVDGNLLEGIWRNLLPAASGWMRPEARSLDELYRLSFPFGPVTMRIVDGTVRVDDPADANRTSDHYIEVVDPTAFTLQFPYRRACITDPATALLASRFTDI